MAAQPSEQEVEYMMAHVADTKVPDILAFRIVYPVAGVASIALRLWGQVISIGRLVLSDWLAIGTWVCLSLRSLGSQFIVLVKPIVAELEGKHLDLPGWLYCSVIVLAQYGLGRHAILLTDPSDVCAFPLTCVASFTLEAGILPPMQHRPREFLLFNLDNLE